MRNERTIIDPSEPEALRCEDYLIKPLPGYFNAGALFAQHDSIDAISKISIEYAFQKSI